MIKNIKELKKLRPDLVELLEGQTHKELLKQTYLEVIDGLNMEERVSLFMQECTNGMSKTTYTIESLKSMISKRQEMDISLFCETALEDIVGMDIDEIKAYLKSEMIHS